MIQYNRKDISNEDFAMLLENTADTGLNITLTVTGNSMFPLWRHKRDSVELSRCFNSGLKKGDIAFYRRKSGQYVLHRIVKVNADSYDICGDAQTQIEHNVNKDEIIAYVKAFTRKGKRCDCRNICFRLYSSLWIATLPLRRLVKR